MVWQASEWAEEGEMAEMLSCQHKQPHRRHNGTMARWHIHCNTLQKSLKIQKQAVFSLHMKIMKPHSWYRSPKTAKTTERKIPRQLLHSYVAFYLKDLKTYFYHLSVEHLLGAEIGVPMLKWGVVIRNNPRPQSTQPGSSHNNNGNNNNNNITETLHTTANEARGEFSLASIIF